MQGEAQVDSVRIEVALVEAGVGWLAGLARYVEAQVTIGVDPGAWWAAVVVPAKGARAVRDRRRDATA